jgi:hypothetical protein
MRSTLGSVEPFSKDEFFNGKGRQRPVIFKPVAGIQVAKCNQRATVVPLGSYRAIKASGLGHICRDRLI